VAAAKGPAAGVGVSGWHAASGWRGGPRGPSARLESGTAAVGDRSWLLGTGRMGSTPGLGQLGLGRSLLAVAWSAAQCVVWRRDKHNTKAEGFGVLDERVGFGIDSRS